LIIVYHIKKTGWVKVHDAYEVDKLHYQYAKEKGKIGGYFCDFNYLKVWKEMVMNFAANFCNLLDSIEYFKRSIVLYCAIQPSLI